MNPTNDGKGVKAMTQLIDKCSTCFKHKSDPARSYDENGKIINGCVDEYHTGELVVPSASARWHYRQEAVKIRAITKRGRLGYGYKSNIWKEVA